MTYGYSQRLVELNRSAGLESIGVVLGKECIRLDIPVRTVAKALGVSRMTVYNWFTGASKPCLWGRERIAHYLVQLSPLCK